MLAPARGAESWFVRKQMLAHAVPHPNGRTVEAVKAARGAENWFVRWRILA